MGAGTLEREGAEGANDIESTGVVLLQSDNGANSLPVRERRALSSMSSVLASPMHTGEDLKLADRRTSKTTSSRN